MKKSDLNILIIEDDKSFQSALAEFAKRKGFSVTVATKPSDALSAIKLRPFHALIVDVMLPGKNGADLVVELKDNLIDGALIYFISGIYKDVSYQTQVLKKVGNAEYLIKPFDAEKLFSVIEKKLSHLLEKPKVDIESLFFSTIMSSKERKKALDHIEDVSGYDLPLIIGTLMDAGASGHLNIVDEDHNIYGMTIVGGSISHVDSEATIAMTQSLLKKYGFLTDLQLQAVPANKTSTEYMHELVNLGIMSPHVPMLVKQETIFNELKRIITNKKINFNFVPDRKLQKTPHDVDQHDLSQTISEILDNQIASEWYKDHFNKWSAFKILKGPYFSKLDVLKKNQLVGKMASLLPLCEGGCTVQTLINQKAAQDSTDVLKALFYLMIMHVFVLEKVDPQQTHDDMADKTKDMYKAIKGKNAIDTFKYFGLTANPSSVELNKFYSEFTKSINWKTIEKNAGAEAGDLAKKLLEHVSDAYDILNTPAKREKLLAELNQKNMDNKVRAENSLSEITTLLINEKYGEAQPILVKMLTAQQSDSLFLHYWWCRFKIRGQMQLLEVEDIERKLKGMPLESKKSALWYFVAGLAKQYRKDPLAVNDFKKALNIDSQFTPARREASIYEIKTEAPLTAEEFLTGDISKVFKSLFKKKGA